MRLLRREFLKTASRLAAAAGVLRVPLAASAADTSLFRWDRIRPDAWAVFNGGGNVLVLADRAGAIVIDCKINGMGRLLRAEIESRIGPIAAVVITHHHGDHSGGFPAFATTGTRIRAIAHAAAVPRIRARADRLITGARSSRQEVTESLLQSLATDFDVPRSPAAERAVATDLECIASIDAATCVPAEQFGDRTELRIGGTTLELIHVGPAHTDNDVFVRDRTRGILHTGDLLFHKHHASIDNTAGGTINGWIAALRDVRQSCDHDTVVIAGHGPTGTRAALDEQAAYFERLRDLVSRERASGRSREDIGKLPNTLFPSYGFAGEWAANLAIAFDEVVTPTPPARARER